MPWAIRLRGDKTTEVCRSYERHRGTVVVRTGLEPVQEPLLTVFVPTPR
jgi:hypothetical protein